MGLGDSLSFITGGPTSNSKAKTANDRETKSWQANDGDARNDAFRSRYEDPSNPNYQGPGYEVYVGEDGHAHARMVDPDANTQWKNTVQNPVPTGNVQAVTDQALDQLDPGTPAAPAAPVDPRTALGTAAARGIGAASGFGTVAGTVAPRQATAAKPPDDFLSRFDLGQGVGAAPAGAEAPTVNREKIDPLLKGIDSVQQKLMGLADETRGMSPAEAALHKASREADLRTAFGVEQSQRAALGSARGSRNRNDRGLLERQAVGEAGFMGQEGARTQALQNAEQEGNLAQLRATEEDADRRFKADVLGKAADLGLNTAAIEVDLSKVDMGSATNWINNEFEKLKADGQLDLGYAQLDEQHAQSILGFTKDMAALQFEYDKLSTDDQNATDALLMQKYGIDQQTMVALKQIKASTGLNWGQILTSVIGGVGSGATAAIAHASDERLKEDIVSVDPAELDELMATVKGETWNYIDEGKHGGGTKGRRFGPMAQDLQKSKLGKAMVLEMPDGFLAVDSGRAGLAALSGLALIHERLKALEGSN
jgi:Chaperone of endosialidase